MDNAELLFLHEESAISHPLAKLATYQELFGSHKKTRSTHHEIHDESSR